MIRLIISEKPSVSASIAYCIGAAEKVSEGSGFYWQGNGYIVTNALGHLFGIGMPEDYGWEKWELETLPLIPQNFKLFPLKGYDNQIAMLKKLLARADVSEVINACDAGREGECIFRYIYNYFGCTKPVKRLWISSLTDESIKQGMANLIDGGEKDNLFSAGFTRAKADWILGMSLSRLYSILNNDKHKVGRVETPVLNIIAERDNSIAAFTKKPFYKVLLDNGAESENIFDTPEQAEALRAKCSGKPVVVSSVISEKKKENRPLLHSLTSLQQEANDIYGMTAADTLKAAQSLYEKKLITYPRTDSNYLSDDMITLVESIVKCLSVYDGKRVQSLQEQGLNIDKRVIDNSKISDHHAIIPTNLIGRLGETQLTENEKHIAELVINRFLCALDKPFTYTETKYEFSVEGELFKLTVKYTDEWGWKWYKKVGDTDEEKVEPNISYSENDTFTVENITVKPCETQPPKRFTESSLLAVMENIDRLIEDKELKGYVKERGLGTSATRASIIEELIAAGYVERKKKQLVSTEYGRAFAASLPENVKSAELTAHWEQALSDIENGNGSAVDLLTEIEKTVNSIITVERSRENRVLVTRNKGLGSCPRCGQPVVENSKGFSCVSKNGGRKKCGFFIWGQDKRIGRSYTAAEISELLSSGKVTLKNCTSSKGNKYSAIFALEDTGQYVNLKLVEFVGGKKRKG